MKHLLVGMIFGVMPCVASAAQQRPVDFAHFDPRTITDLNRDGVIDGADIGLALLGEGADEGLDVGVPAAPTAMSLTGSGARGLHGNSYIVDVAGVKYSVIDVYIKWGSAVGTGTSAERVVAIFGQSITDAATGNVNKSARYENSASLPFQHLNTSWLPGSASGASTWDSFLTIGCRTQGAGNSANVTADPFFLNPSAGSAAGVASVTGGSDSVVPPRFVGAGVYQAAPTDSGWETNVATFPDSMILIGRFALKVSDVVAAGGNVTLKVHTNFTGRSTAQGGGTTVYTVSAANLKSDAQTTYTASGQTWTFSSSFVGTDLNQQPWTFPTGTLFVPSQYSTIQAAIDAAPSTGGWTVAVAPGTYNEAIDLKGKAITVKATGARASTIIDGTGLTTSVVRAVTGETSATVLEGFTIRKGALGSSVNTFRLGGGMYLDRASPTIRDCTFSENLAGYGGGLYGVYSNSLVENCTFDRNSASSDGGGVQFFGGTPIIRNCTISNNSAGNNGGGTHLVQHVSGGFPTLENCSIHGNRTSVGDGGGVSVYAITGQSPKPLVRSCTIQTNSARGLGGGLISYIDPAAPGQNVVLDQNTICSNTSDSSDRENTWALYEDLGNAICDCFSDIDGDGSVDTGDLGFALLFVGEATNPNFIEADQDMNGFVDTGDIALLLLNFGPCS
jgi:hypothetical protein